MCGIPFVALLPGDALLMSAASFSAPVDELRRRQFEMAWQSDRPAAIESYLPPAESDAYLGTLFELVCIDLEYRWKSRVEGGREQLASPYPVVEDYLSTYPRLMAEPVLARLLREEIQIRRHYDDAPTTDDLKQRFPQLSGIVEELLATATHPAVSTIPVMSSDAPSVERGGDPDPRPGVNTETHGPRRGGETIVRGRRGNDRSAKGPGSNPPQEFGDYELLKQVAAGAMGVVYQARQKSLGRIVALKFIRKGQFADEHDVRRFLKEAEHAAQLTHPHIVPVYEVGQHEGWPFFAMGYVEGVSLQARLATGDIDAREAARIVATIAEAVAFAHERGIIHRDLKPANVLINEHGQPVVTDFGLAKRMDAAGTLTEPGQVMGTPAYMPPEQACGETDKIGPHSDQYSLGVILYELLTGRRPFEGPMHLVLAKVIGQEPPLVRELAPRAPRDLEAICWKAMQKKPENRYASVGDMADDLRRSLRDDAIRARHYGTRERVARFVRKRRGVFLSLTALCLASLATWLVAWGLRPPPETLPDVWSPEDYVDRNMTVISSRQNLQAIGLALHNYHNTYKQFPARAISDPEGTPLLSWRVAILPYLGQEALYRKFRLNEPWDSPHNRELLSLMPENYSISGISTPAPYSTFYCGVVGEGASFDPDPKRKITLRDMRDGTQGTLIVAESARAVPWTSPEDIDCDARPIAGQLGGAFPEGYHGLMVDGSVRFFKAAIYSDGEALASMVGREEGDVVDLQPYLGFPNDGLVAKPDADFQQRLDEQKRQAEATKALAQKVGQVVSSANSLRALQMAMSSYESEHGRLPPAAIADGNGRPLLSWRVALLPYLEHRALYDKFRREEPWDSPHNLQYLSLMPDVFRIEGSPSSQGPVTYFQVLVGHDTPFPPDYRQIRSREIDNADGLSHTIAVVEGSLAVPWTKPQDVNLAADEPFPQLGGSLNVGFQTVMFDGSVRSLVNDIYNEERTLWAMSGHRDGTLFRIAPFAKDFTQLPELRVEPDPRMAGAVASARTAALRSQSNNRLRQIALALHRYHDAHRTYPPPAICDAQGQPLLSWRVALLPYLDEKLLYKSFQLDEPWDSERNRVLLAHNRPEVYASPTETVGEETYYQLVSGRGTAFDLERRRGERIIGASQRDITDGVRQTLMLVEGGEPVPWTKPDDFLVSADKPLPKLGGIFLEGFHAAAFDGSVRFILHGHSEAKLRAAFSISDGQSFDLRSLEQLP
jgi:serine/threonine protein kinase